jgi:DNA-binding MarR family transcriptional regulator
MQRDKLIEQFFNSSQTMQRAWKSQFYKVVRDAEVPPAQIGLLFLIKHKQPVNGRDIAAEMQITRSAVTQLIDALEQLGYIERQEDKNDRRISNIQLSKKGTQKLNKLEKKRKELLTRLASALDDDELKAIVAINSKMIQELER